MRTLDDEIAALLSADPMAASALAKRLAADVGSVRYALRRLKAEKRAHLIVRGRTIYAASLEYAGRVCVMCGKEYTRGKKSKRRTCSRACAVALSWQKPGAREKKIAAIKAERQTERAKARIAAHNQRRWSKPEEHEKLSEQNRRAWADPYKAAKRSVGIKKAHSTPEKRKFYSESRKKEWADPVERARRSKIIKEAKNTPEYKAKHRELMTERWRDPVMRAKYTAANRKRNEERKRRAAEGRAT